MLNDPFVQARLSEIKALDEQVWEHRCPVSRVKQFLECLSNEDILRQAGVTQEFAYRFGAHLASRIQYFGSFEIRHLLKSVFRNIVIPTVQRRGARSVAEVKQAICSTRFLGMGNPAKSGAHLLYLFRQENGLAIDNFCTLSELFAISDKGLTFRAEEDVSMLVFLDDFSGTGKQATRFLRRQEGHLSAFKASASRSIHVCFLIATVEALREVRENQLVDSVDAVFELDDTFRAFGENSRLFRGVEFDRNRGMALLRTTGAQLQPKAPLGRDDCQLLLAFHHNTPNNSLPPVWSDAAGWSPLFPRYHQGFWR